MAGVRRSKSRTRAAAADLDREELLMDAEETLRHASWLHGRLQECGRDALAGKLQACKAQLDEVLAGLRAEGGAG